MSYEIEKEADLVCEALVREIGRASRWSAVLEAWTALLHVRLIAKPMIAEAERLGGRHIEPNCTSQKVSEIEEDEWVIQEHKKGT